MENVLKNYFRKINLKGLNIAILGGTGTLGSLMSEEIYESGGNIFVTGRNGFEAERTHLNVDLDRKYQKIEYFDCILNCVGSQGRIGKFADTDFDTWMDNLNNNLDYSLRFINKHIHSMRDRGFGRIVNISGGGATIGRPYFSSYACAKTALVRFTEILAMEEVENNILCNCVSPGMFYSRMTEEVVDAGLESVGEKEYYEATRCREECKTINDKTQELILYLLSPQNTKITGKLISGVWDSKDEIINSYKNYDKYKIRRLE